MSKWVRIPIGYRRAAAGVVGCILVGSTIGIAVQGSTVSNPSHAPVRVEPSSVAASFSIPGARVSNDLLYLRVDPRRLVPEHEETRVVTYAIATGDTFWSIARERGIDLNALLARNSGVDPHRLQPGQVVYLLPAPGDAPPPDVQVADSEESPRRILASRGTFRREPPPASNEPPAAAPESKQPQPAAPPSPPPTPPASQPSTPPPPAAGLSWIWPIDGGIHSSEFGWREDGFHTGHDIAVPVGTSAVAARSGTVIFSGWDGGYGYCVLLDHGDGYKSRYAHASTLLVQPGQHVQQGEPVILVGSTGRSTGPHLHFEIIVNGKPHDPREFLP